MKLRTASLEVRDALRFGETLRTLILEVDQCLPCGHLARNSWRVASIRKLDNTLCMTVDMWHWHPARVSGQLKIIPWAAQMSRMLMARLAGAGSGAHLERVSSAVEQRTKREVLICVDQSLVSNSIPDWVPMPKCVELMIPIYLNNVTFFEHCLRQ